MCLTHEKWYAKPEEKKTLRAFKLFRRTLGKYASVFYDAFLYEMDKEYEAMDGVCSIYMDDFFYGSAGFYALPSKTAAKEYAEYHGLWIESGLFVVCEVELSGAIVTGNQFPGFDGLKASQMRIISEVSVNEQEV